jgi:hypothetical protein
MNVLEECKYYMFNLVEKINVYTTHVVLQKPLQCWIGVCKIMKMLQLSLPR